MKDGTQQSVTLVVRQTMQAPPREVYAAWTEPSRLKEWWGPEGVACIGAEMDLRVGGAYRIGNRFPDGKVIWLAGSFEAIEPPRLLMYTW
ncbi:MAG TPA: SRPBCC domain-containing protein, partial [Gammaproteobacteria bacterium]|nr:SRPBCC domain-containing protein [Gammaproteobacteria bacterium]